MVLITKNTRIYRPKYLAKLERPSIQINSCSPCSSKDTEIMTSNSGFHLRNQRSEDTLCCEFSPSINNALTIPKTLSTSAIIDFFLNKGSFLLWQRRHSRKINHYHTTTPIIQVNKWYIYGFCFKSSRQKKWSQPLYSLFSQEDEEFLLRQLEHGFDLHSDFSKLLYPRYDCPWYTVSEILQKKDSKLCMLIV